MARSLLNTLSTAEIVLIVVGGSVLLAIALTFVIRKAVPDIAESMYEDLASGLRVVYELLFALILAFVIASVLDKFNEAQSVVDSEATALAQLVRDNRLFPAGDEVRLNRGIGAYVDAVTNDEWDTMSEGRSSPEAAAALDSLFALYGDFRPPEDASLFYEQALDHLDVVAASRRERIGISDAKLPSVLVLMLPIGALLLLVLEYRPRLAPRSQAGFMGTLALVLSASYLLTIVLDYPFSGDVSVSTDPLTTGVLAFLVDPEPRKPQPGDRPKRLTAEDLEGVWSSEAYGTVMLRRHEGELRGVDRSEHGTIRGIVSDGVFRGTWCEGTREAPEDAGLLEWRLVDTRSEGEIVTGIWSEGYDRRPDGSFEVAGGWDLRPLERDEALDLERRLNDDPEEWYCREP